ncbi:hypothetical protein BGZ97_005768 [Linnemannia gamsii]|uniref:Uncharacterized protein n=1 Tax=Linnemannia gamsii TaxID=64522 RepID=A0A9P6QUX1_9FUNG|nr:hypothetical protein BGZ97_005768 [Linnemannia gamsii]
MSLICTAFVLSWVYGMGPLVRIVGNSGCGSAAYQGARGRCAMQLSVSIAEIMWTILMFIEGVVTDKRNRDKVYREEMGWSVRDEDHVLASRARAQAEAAEANGVVEYRPDLSLEGAGGPTGGRRRVVGVEDGDNDEVDGGDVEMEPLPPYMPKARSNQAVIIDMANRSLNLRHRRTKEKEKNRRTPKDSNRNISREIKPRRQVRAA